MAIAFAKLNDLLVQVCLCIHVRISKLLAQRLVLSLGSEERRAVQAIFHVVVAVALVVHPDHQSDHRQVRHHPSYE